MTRIDRSLTPEQEDDFFAGRPVPPRLRRRDTRLFWGVLAWALAVASFICAYTYAQVF